MPECEVSEGKGPLSQNLSVCNRHADCETEDERVFVQWFWQLFDRRQKGSNDTELEDDKGKREQVWCDVVDYGIEQYA